MTPDYDLSNLETAQVNLWLYLHIGDICAQIAAGRSSGQPSEVRLQGDARENAPRAFVFGKEKVLTGSV